MTDSPTKDYLSNIEAEKALVYLIETDDECAKAKARLDSTTHQEKAIRASAYLETSGTVDERKAKTELNPSVMQIRRQIDDAILEYETIKIKRATKEIQIEMWRSMNANRRQGQI